MTTPTLSLQNVSKSFAGKPAVIDVSFDVSPGEIVGFLGPNGAGKTTALRMSLGLIAPDEGEIKMFGDEPGVKAFGRIGFLPEERGLYKKQTARESIAYMAQLNGMKKREAFVRADSLLDRYGLSDVKYTKNNKLSKGMAQKVQLLAAIAHDPEFYILDEPFSGLDPVNQQVLQDMVREIARTGRTILFSTHVMEHAERLCNRIILMSNGHKVFDGTVAQALEKAPKRLTIAADDDRLQSVISPYALSIQREANGDFELTLKSGADTQAILESCVAKKIKLTRFNPHNPSLHEVFVETVGQQEAAKMKVPA